ncbi:MAG: hypothetical protein ACRDLZ_08660 [Gaiellaceae bacterium]
MTDLGDLLELANRAPGSFRTLRATVRTWRDEELCQAFARAFEQLEADGHGRTITMYAFDARAGAAARGRCLARRRGGVPPPLVAGE